MPTNHNPKYLKRLANRQRLYRQEQAKKERLAAEKSTVFIPTGQSIFGPMLGTAIATELADCTPRPDHPNVRKDSNVLMQHQKELMEHLLPGWDGKEPRIIVIERIPLSTGK